MCKDVSNTLHSQKNFDADQWHKAKFSEVNEGQWASFHFDQGRSSWSHSLKLVTRTKKLNILEDKHFRASEIMHRICFTALATVQVVNLQTREVKVGNIDIQV